MSANAFKPTGNSYALAVTSTSTGTPIQTKGSTTNTAANNNATQRLISNAGDKGCFLAWSVASNVVAVAPVAGTPANGIYIAAGAVMVLTFQPNAYFAAICAGSDTTTLYLSPGEGD